MPGESIAGSGLIQEDQVIATAIGTYVPGGITVTMTKCSQLLVGSLVAQVLGAGYMATPVSGSEVGASVKVQFWQSGGSALPFLELASGSTSVIGQKVRFTYIGV